MRLAQDKDVVHTFTPDRSDQPRQAPEACWGIWPDSGLEMARSRHADRPWQCPLIAEDRKWAARAQSDAIDPERTFDLNGLLTWPNTFLKW